MSAWCSRALAIIWDRGIHISGTLSAQDRFDRPSLPAHVRLPKAHIGDDWDTWDERKLWSTIVHGALVVAIIGCALPWLHISRYLATCGVAASCPTLLSIN
jgi:hypothetical protein